MSGRATPTTVRADEIAADLRRQILGGKYEEGERLPSERDLAARLGVHRSSVREALKKLEQLGMIRIRRGGGARVLPLEEAGLGVLPHLLMETAPQRELIAQWLDVWELVLSGAARLALERATDEEVARARELLAELKRKSASPAELVATGDELTSLIADASRNVVLRMVRNGLTAQLQTRSELRLQVIPTGDEIVSMVDQIEQAIEARDPAAVEEAVRRVVRNNRDTVLDWFAPSDVH